MAYDTTGNGSDARRAGRPVVLSAALGVAAFAVTFAIALALGRSLAGSVLAALLLPLALSGALALGLAVGFVVATVAAQPYGVRRMSRVVTVAAPLAALVALFVYAADPAAQVGPPREPAGDAVATPPRTVSVAPPATPVTPVTPPEAAPQVRPVAVAAPVAGPVVPEAAPADPAEVVPPRVVLGGGGGDRTPAAVAKAKGKTKLRRCGARRRGVCLGRH